MTARQSTVFRIVELDASASEFYVDGFSVLWLR